MLHYLSLVLRTLRRRKTHTAIHLTGLSVGVSAFMIIIAYASHSLSYDKFWRDHENIYRATFFSKKDGKITDRTATNWMALAAVAQDEVPEMEAVTRFAKFNNWFPNQVTVNAGNNRNAKIDTEFYLLADSSFFDVFDCKFMRGKPQDYKKVGSIVLTASTADKIFGKSWRDAEVGSSADPIGKTIEFRVGSAIMYTFTNEVTAIIEDMPTNSHLDMVGVFNLTVYSTEWGSTWGYLGNYFYTYFKLMPETDTRHLQTKLNTIGKQYDKRVKDGYELSFPLQPITDIHLHSDLIQEIKPLSNYIITWSLSVIAVLVLLMAWLNYLNLSLVQSMDQIREVGVRKILGASTRELIQQFLLSALVLNIMSSIISFFLLHFSIGYINQYLGTAIELTIYYQGIPTTYLFWTIFVGIFLAGSLISGIYPSIVLSAFKPTAALKGRITTDVVMLGGSVRNVIITSQFVITFLVLTGTFIVLGQISHMQSYPLGFDSEKVVILENSFSLDSAFNKRMNFFVDKLSKQSTILQTSVSSSYPGHHNTTWHYAPTGTNAFREYTIISADYDFLKCYGIQMVKGRYFDKDIKGDERRVVINETATKILGYDSPQSALYTKIQDDAHPDNVLEIIGVVQDYHHESLHSEISPIIYQLPQTTFTSEYIKGEKSKSLFKNFNKFISIKIADGQPLSDAIKILQDAWNESFEGTAMNYFFLDERYNAQYRNEELFSKVFALFSGLATLIAGLGLIGFITYSLKQRSKEIAIRKTLGATILQLWLLLTKIYLKLFLLAMIIVIPIINYFATDWLDGFAYRIGQEQLLWIYLVPGALMLVITLFSISGQAVKAARVNPVDSLRYE